MLVPFVLFVLYFLSISIYVVAKLYLIKSDLVKIDRESEMISKEMTVNDEKLKRYVLSKFILEKIEALNNEKFPYKDYLNQLVSFMPSGVVLNNVDFSNKGWISVSASILGVNPLKSLEESLSRTDSLSLSMFGSVFAEGISRDKSGLYNAKLQFEIKKNAGK
ncbi:MAG: hypothetical protein UW88_C0001G0091 [Candidatus Collierbacteria bacterium GW2011_GWD2_45_10]|nr:MAG: hypothetical protein UW88_C0001G0091 [Candidatus Collierbacteria bacterium GW2011_GWD2_45_10]